MMEEPVQKASAMSMKPNGTDIHRISSSENRDRCIITKAALAQNSTTKSRSLTASNEFSATVSNPSNSAA